MLQDFRNIVRPARYYLDEAEKAKENGEFGYARKMLRSGTEQHPDNARLWQELGKSLRSNPKWDDETLKCFARAYELNPGSRHIAMEYASFLDRKNQYGRAEEILMNVLAGEGDSPRLYCALGHHFQLQKKYPLALACFARSRAMEPDGDFSNRRYEEVSVLAGRECCEEDQKKLSFRIVQMTGRFTPAKAPEAAISG